MTERPDYTGEPGPTGPTGPTGPEGPEGPPGTTTWAGITDKPTEFTPEDHADHHEAGGTDKLLAASYVNRWTRPGRLYASNGTTLKSIDNLSYSVQASPENEDRMQMFFICAGAETVMNIGTNPTSYSGIFDLYVNSVLDSSGYDEYASTSTNLLRYITLTQPLIAGLNTIELRVNGKNINSGGYRVRTYGASLQ